MKLSFVTPFTPIPRIVKRLKAFSHVGETHLIYWDRGTDTSFDNSYLKNVIVDRVRIPTNNGSPLKRIFKSIKFSINAIAKLKKQNPDIVHVTKTDMLLTVYIYTILFNRSCQVIYEVSDLHFLALNQSRAIGKRILKKLLFYIEKICFKNVSKLIITSPLFYEYYYINLIDKENVIYLPNSPNENIFSEYKYNDEKNFTISFIGKVRYVNQLKMLIDLSEELEFNILIAGNGVGLDKIKSYSEGNKFVEITGEYIYKDDIIDLYERSDAIYSVYDPEILNVRIALPNRLYEAAYCGLPVIVAKDTYLEKVVLENNLGYSVSAYSKNELKELIYHLINNYSREKFEISGKEFYHKNSNLSNFNKTVNVLKEMQ